MYDIERRFSFVVVCALAVYFIPDWLTLNCYERKKRFTKKKKKATEQKQTEKTFSTEMAALPIY